MQNRRFRLLKTFALILMTSLSSALFAQNAKAEQKLEWHADRNAFYYRVELMNAATGKSTFIKTETNTTTVSLEPGKYRYRIYVYDFLDRESSVNEWTDFDVFKANPPLIKKADKKVMLPKDGDEFAVKAEITHVSEFSTVVLVNQATARETTGKLVLTKNTGGNETGTAQTALFPYVKSGDYCIKITNRSGHSVLSEPITIVDPETIAKQKAQEETLANSMKVPVILEIPSEIVLPETGESFKVKAEITNLVKGAKASLVNNINGMEMPGKLHFTDKSDSLAADSVEFYRVDEGLWHLKVTNPNGNFSESETFEITDKLEELRRKDAENRNRELEKQKTKKEKEAEKQDKEVKAAPKEKEERSRGHNEIGIYLKDYIPLQRMANHSDNFLGAGLMYNFYFNPKSRINTGLCMHVDAETVMADIDYIEEWYAFNGFGGLFLNFRTSDIFSIQAQAGGGVQLDYVRTLNYIESISIPEVNGSFNPERINDLYFSPVIEFALAFKLSPGGSVLDGISAELTPFYTLAFENDGSAQYFGVRLGLNYRFARKKR